MQFPYFSFVRFADLKSNIFLKNPRVLVLLKYLGIFESINKGSTGLKSPEIMEFGGVRPSHNKTKILLDQK